MSKILLVGSSGQMGQTFRSLSIPNVTWLLAPNTNKLKWDERAFLELVRNSDAVINCAAWTDLPGAEKYGNMPEVRFLNVVAPEFLAGACKKYRKPFLTYSTDYVFDGKIPRGVRYEETDEPNPINNYGRTKLAGERLALENNPEAFIVRTAGIYSRLGKNFVKNLSRNLQVSGMATVVEDLITNVTHAENLARISLFLLASGADPGVYHYVDSPPVSWFDVASVVKSVVRPGGGVAVQAVNYDPNTGGLERPKNSALSTKKIRALLGVPVSGPDPAWKFTKLDIERTVKEIISDAT